MRRGSLSVATRSADDFATIRRRVAELETERGVLPPGCLCAIAEAVSGFLDGRFRVENDSCSVHCRHEDVAL